MFKFRQTIKKCRSKIKIRVKKSPKVHVPALNQNKNSVEIPLSLGHLSHFRQSYLDTPSIHTEYTIKQLYFDYNYFSNYFKPILVNRFN